MKIFALLTLCLSLLMAAACAGESPTATPTPTTAPDLEATVQAAVSAALPTETPTPMPDINATVAAGIEATQAAAPTPTSVPAATPDVDATVEARMAATIAAMPTPTATPTHTPTPTASPTPTPIPTATPTPTQVPTATPRPTPRPRPTSTPRPTATPTPNPAASLSAMVRQTRPSVVRIRTSDGVGSGAIFETQGQTAYIITNQHVVEGATQVAVTVNDSNNYTGTVLGTDRTRDLAVVRICCGSFRALSFGNASGLEAGDEVVAIGYALGLTGEATITRGIVSAVRYDSDYRSDVIQTDAAINLGNSGGPMLSMSGQIIGINTFRIDESQSGRSAEGLGFAVSATTVLQQIPALKAARAAPTPTPTRRPTPTPSYGGGYGSGFGPVDGELWHDPSDGFIKQEYADVWMSDFIVSATFTNPYSSSSNDWDYGFIIRRNGTESTARFITVAVTSRGRWDVSWRQGASSDNQEIAEGRLGRFDTSAGGRNGLWLAAFGEHGLLFVNGEFVSSLDLSDVTGPGDIAVITGAFTGNEVAGAVTRYEDFQTGSMRKGYGPASGTLESDPGSISSHSSGVWAQDLVTEATFTNPPGRDWSYGFVIRNPEYNHLEVIGVTGNDWWFHETRSVGDDEYTEVSEGRLSSSLSGENHLMLFAIEDWGMLFVNGQLVSRLDLSHNMDYGNVSAMGGFYNDQTREPSFSNFNVWTP